MGDMPQASKANTEPICKRRVGTATVCDIRVPRVHLRTLRDGDRHRRELWPFVPLSPRVPPLLILCLCRKALKAKGRVFEGGEQEHFSTTEPWLTRDKLARLQGSFWENIRHQILLVHNQLPLCLPKMYMQWYVTLSWKAVISQSSVSRFVPLFSAAINCKRFSCFMPGVLKISLSLCQDCLS